jgi:hypothetical protein
MNMDLTLPWPHCTWLSEHSLCTETLNPSALLMSIIFTYGTEMTLSNVHNTQRVSHDVFLSALLLLALLLAHFALLLCDALDALLLLR